MPRCASFILLLLILLLYALVCSIVHMHWWFSFIVLGFCLTCVSSIFLSDASDIFVSWLIHSASGWFFKKIMCYSDSVLSYCLYISHLFWQAVVISSRHSKGNYTTLYSLLSSYHLPTSARWLWFCSILNYLTWGGGSWTFTIIKLVSIRFYGTCYLTVLRKQAIYYLGGIWRPTYFTLHLGDCC